LHAFLRQKKSINNQLNLEKMKSVSMSGLPRVNVGKKDAKAQRKQGFIPCVMYGGEKQLQFIVPEQQFKDVIYTPEVKYVELELEGNNHITVIQDTQWHPITDKLLHVDFLEVDEKRQVTMGIPVQVVGTSPGVLRGGKLVKKYRKLKVKGLLQNLPEKIEIDITPLDINDAIKVSDIQLDNIIIVENPGTIIVSVASTRNVEQTQQG